MPQSLSRILIHMVFSTKLSRTRTIAEVAEIVKTSSSKWIKTKGAEFSEFHRQGGYGTFSVSQSAARSVVRYIRGQEEHHRAKTFQEEFIELLRRHDVTYDECYVWD